MAIKNNGSASSIINLLKMEKKPVDASFLVEKLDVNKTTVYRQIDKLVKDKKIVEVELGEGKKRYEINDLNHHHHLVCRQCGKLDDISFDEKDLLTQIQKKTHFEVESHSLEFFGLCSDCK